MREGCIKQYTYSKLLLKLFSLIHICVCVCYVFVCGLVVIDSSLLKYINCCTLLWYGQDNRRINAFALSVSKMTTTFTWTLGTHWGLWILCKQHSPCVWGRSIVLPPPPLLELVHCSRTRGMCMSIAVNPVDWYRHHHPPSRPRLWFYSPSSISYVCSGTRFWSGVRWGTARAQSRCVAAASGTG